MKGDFQAIAQACAFPAEFHPSHTEETLMSLFKLPVLVAACYALLAGCGSQDDPMLSAIRETVTAHSESASFGGSACLPVTFVAGVQPDSAGRPLPIFEDPPVPSVLLRTLVSHGLLRPEAAGPRGQARFGLTPEGIKYLRHEALFPNVSASRWNWALCTGSMKVTKIEGFTKPTDLFGQTITSVNYRYTMDGTADWAADAQLQSLSPRFARHFLQPVGQMDLIQTTKAGEASTCSSAKRGW
jgi:hypothetical protein